jgi:hypothetical protein
MEMLCPLELTRSNQHWGLEGQSSRCFPVHLAGVWVSDHYTTGLTVPLVPLSQPDHRRGSPA